MPDSSNLHKSGRTFQVHGHRGARARYPENTLPAFEYAIALGVDAVEMDLAATKDDVVVISHDPVSPSGAAIRASTWAEVSLWDCGGGPTPEFPEQRRIAGTRMPTLEQVFQLKARGAFLYNCEIKSYPERPDLAPAPDEFAALVLDKIRLHNLRERVIVQSFDFRTLRAMRQLAPEICIAALVEDDGRDFAAIAREAADAEIVAPEFHLLTARKVEDAHRAGVRVIPWTANTPADWQRLIESGVDGIITDDPERLIEFSSR